MKLARILGLGAGLGLLATLGGCVVAPYDPYYGGPTAAVAVAPPVVVAPAPHYYYGYGHGYYRGYGPRYYR